MLLVLELDVADLALAAMDGLSATAGMTVVRHPIASSTFTRN